jgi:glycosyltransferase EpsF
VKILHVLRSFEIGGIETWLSGLVKLADRKAYKFEFLLTDGHQGCLENAISEAELPIHRIEIGESTLNWMLRLRRFLRDESEFDAVHSHFHLGSGVVLAAARLANVPLRFAHLHTITSNQASRLGDGEKVEMSSRKLIMSCATHFIGASDLALVSFLGPDWSTRLNARKVLYGIDVDAFYAARANRKRVRSKLGIAEGTLVIGNVGRFVPFKNQKFLLPIYQCLVKRDVPAYLLMIGDGPTRPEIEAQAKKLSSGSIRFLGERTDIPDLLSAMDVFVFPSWTEGLGIVALEAQAAGLPVVASNTLPDEVDVVPGAVMRLSLNNPPSTWASEVQTAAQRRYNGSYDLGPYFVGTRQTINESSKALEECYEAAAIHDGAQC